jgi:hypothetical protein
MVGKGVEEEEQAESAQTPVHFPRLPPNVARLGTKPEDCLCVVIDDVLSLKECHDLIKQGTLRLRRVDEALDRYQPGRTSSTTYKLAVMNDVAMSEIIWSRLRERVGDEIRKFSEREACGSPFYLTPRLRLLCYTGEDRFDAHYDRIVPDDDNKLQSLITVLIYLNNGGGDAFEGGETLFLDAKDPSQEGACPIVPKAGRVVLFEHGLYHCGSPLSSTCGSKYVMRTDVMFQIKVDKSAPSGNIADLLRDLHLDHMRDTLDECGLLVSFDAFRLPGREAVKEILSDLGIDIVDIQTLTEAAFACT